MIDLNNPKLWDVLVCPSCKGLLEPQEKFLCCKREAKQFSILSGIPCLYDPPDDYIKDQLHSINEERKSFNKVEEPFYTPLKEIWMERIIRIEQKLKEALPRRVSGEMKAKIRRYTEKYQKCINDDEYILSAYGPFIKLEGCPSTGDAIGSGISEGLYSTVLNLGKTLPRDAKVVEIGSGIGRTLLDYSELAKEGIVIGLELEFNKAYMASNILKTKNEMPFVIKDSLLHRKAVIEGFGKTNIMLILTDVEKYLPLKENRFDCVIIVFLLGLLKDPRALLEKVSRLLRPGGILVVADDHGWEELRPEITRTEPSMVNETLEKEGLRIELEFDTPYLEILNGRMYHIHFTRMLRAVKTVESKS